MAPTHGRRDTIGGVLAVGEQLKQLQLKADRISSYPRVQKMRELSGDPPEVLIVDGEGNPRGRWQGTLSRQQEAEIEALDHTLR